MIKIGEQSSERKGKHRSSFSPRGVITGTRRRPCADYQGHSMVVDRDTRPGGRKVLDGFACTSIVSLSKVDESQSREKMGMERAVQYAGVLCITEDVRIRE